MGMIVLVSGELHGMGRTVPCGLVALRQSVPGGQNSRRLIPDHVYSDYGVIEAPADLPDGEYTVQIGKHKLNTTKQRGIWLTCSESKCN